MDALTLADIAWHAFLGHVITRYDLDNMCAMTNDVKVRRWWTTLTYCPNFALPVAVSLPPESTASSEEGEDECLSDHSYS